MGKCVVKDCVSKTEKYNKACGITFHAVPTDAIRREKWVKIIRLLRRETDWLPTKHTKICSKHFRHQDKIGSESECGRVYLSNKAIPMLADESHLKPEPDDDGNMNEDETIDLGVETDEEITEYIETPEKNKMRKTILRLKLVCANRLKKIKNLLGKNRRLVKKKKNLLTVIKELKKKIHVEKKKKCNKIEMTNATHSRIEKVYI